MADLCDNVGATVQDVSRGSGMDSRIRSKSLHAGLRLWRQLPPKGYARAAQDLRGLREQKVVEVQDTRKRASGRSVCGREP